MKIPIIDSKNNEIKKIELPSQFNEELRLDLIKRAFLAIMSHKRQPYGAKPKAGMRASAKLSRRRRNFKTSYGIGISRVPRKILSGKGTRWNWVGAVAPGTVGGRKAHPPKAEKIWAQKINKKEKKKAIRSAITATISKEIVGMNNIPETYPFIITSDVENIKKTKDVKNLLKKIGFEKKVEITKKKIRAGKGKMRNRKYRKRHSLLLVVSDKCSLLKSATNIAELDVIEVKKLNVGFLAPGLLIRPALFTEKAIEKLLKENLFY